MKTNALLLALAMVATLVASASAQVIEIEKLGKKKEIRSESKADDVVGTIVIEKREDDGKGKRRVIRLGEDGDGIEIRRQGKARVILIGPDGERHERVLDLGDDDEKAKKSRKRHAKREKKRRKAHHAFSFGLGDGEIDIEIDGKDLGEIREHIEELLGEHGEELREHVEDVIEEHAEEHFEGLHDHLEEIIGEHAEEHLHVLRGHIGEMLEGDGEDIENHVLRLFRKHAAPHGVRTFRWRVGDDEDCCEEDDCCEEECEEGECEEECEEEVEEHHSESRLRKLLGAVRGQKPRAMVRRFTAPDGTHGFFHRRAPRAGGQPHTNAKGEIDRLQQRLDELRAEMSEIDSQIRRLRRKL